MAYNFPKDRVYSIKQAQKRLELSDDELERCLDNGWLRLALPISKISKPGGVIFLCVSQSVIDSYKRGIEIKYQPLPNYLYSLNERHLEMTEFANLSGALFDLIQIAREKDGADRATTLPPTRLAALISGKSQNSINDDGDPWDIISSHLVVPDEEIERFLSSYRSNSSLEKIAEQESLKPVEKARLRRSELKAQRQSVVSKFMAQGLTKDLAKNIHEKIKSDPGKFGFSRVPSIKTLQNDVTEIKKRQT